MIKAISRIFKKKNSLNFYYESRLNEMINDIEGGGQIDVDRDDTLLIEEMTEAGYQSDSLDRFLKISTDVYNNNTGSKKMNREQLIEILKNTNTKAESSSLDEMIKNELMCWGENSTAVDRW